MMVCGPKTLIPKHIEKLNVKVSNNLKEALEWCDVANMLRIQLERQEVKYFPSLREYAMTFGLNKEILDSLNKKTKLEVPPRQMLRTWGRKNLDLKMEPT